MTNPVFPLDIVDKVDHPDFLEVMLGVERKYYYSAEDWNKIKNGVNYLFDIFNYSSTFNDVINFEYDGTNNAHFLSFTPIGIGSCTTLQNLENEYARTLDPYYDFKYSENTIIIKPEILVYGSNYKLITNYIKS